MNNKLRYAMFPEAYLEGKLLSQVPTSTVGDFEVVRNSIGTRVNKDGLIEVMDANVPRLDYLDGGCPKLLTEASASNRIYYSESLNLWENSGSVTTTIGQISPKGDNSAVKITTSTNQDFLKNTAFLGLPSNRMNTSFFIKNIDSNQVGFLSWGSSLVGQVNVIFKGSEISSLSIGGTTTYAEYEEYPNGWYRVSYDFVEGATQQYQRVYVQNNGGGASALIWGVQMEVGGLKTSYIPSNNGDFNTRQADQVKTLINNDIYPTLDGVFFTDIRFDDFGKCGIFSSNGDYDRMQFDYGYTGANDFRTICSVTGANISISLPTTSSVHSKKAVRYGNQGLAIYENGQQVYKNINTILTFPNNKLNNIILGSSATGSTDASVKSIQFYDYLTDAEMEQLTGYDSYSAMTSQFNFNVL